MRSQDLADQYVQDFESDLYLARGHMSPNADFMFYSWMDATYHFINVSPQWQAFNGGNWMFFENGVRDFVVERALDIVVYTGGKVLVRPTCNYLWQGPTGCVSWRMLTGSWWTSSSTTETSNARVCPAPE